MRFLFTLQPSLSFKIFSFAATSLETIGGYGA